MKLVPIAVLSFLLFGLSYSQPHPRTCRQEKLTECPKSGPFKFPTLTQDTDFKYVITDDCPPYDNPKWTNPSQACMFQKKYKIPLVPKRAITPIPVGEKLQVFEKITYLKEDPKPILGAIGILINGVDIYGVGSPCGYSSKCPSDGGPSKWVDAVESEGHTVDNCGGHAAPTHQYHVHSGVGMVTEEDRKSCELPIDKPGEHSNLLGWLFDGYRLYGRYSLNGSLPTDLDACGGHTHFIKGVQTYHYHIPGGFPWIIGCYYGCPEVSNNPNELSFTRDSIYGC